VSTVDAHHSQNRFVRAAAAIGDLSNPFYREERQRDVWNEASAVAFQVLIWLHLAAATAVVWFVGADAMPYVYALIAMIGLASWIAILYAASLGVRVDSRTRMARGRLIPVLVLVVLLVVGMIRAQVDRPGFDDWSTIAGAVTGAAAVLVLFAAGSWYARRRTRAREED
jgi:protein-S-isoprenylcysteine O-methyltransferase Ste14